MLAHAVQTDTVCNDLTKHSNSGAIVIRAWRYWSVQGITCRRREVLYTVQQSCKGTEEGLLQTPEGLISVHQSL